MATYVVHIQIQAQYIHDILHVNVSVCASTLLMIVWSKIIAWAMWHWSKKWSLLFFTSDLLLPRSFSVLSAFAANRTCPKTNLPWSMTYSQVCETSCCLRQDVGLQSVQARTKRRQAFHRYVLGPNCHCPLEESEDTGNRPWHDSNWARWATDSRSVQWSAYAARLELSTMSILDVYWKTDYVGIDEKPAPLSHAPDHTLLFMASAWASDLHRLSMTLSDRETNASILIKGLYSHNVNHWLRMLWQYLVSIL